MAIFRNVSYEKVVSVQFNQANTINRTISAALQNVALGVIGSCLGLLALGRTHCLLPFLPPGDGHRVNISAGTLPGSPKGERRSRWS